MRVEPRPLFAVLALLAGVSLLGAQPSRDYFPERRNWETRTPEEMGMNSQLLDQAIQFAIEHENPAPKDLALNHELSSFGREPHGERIGPTTVRAPLNGLVVRKGYIVAEWGDTQKVDMTFSVTKTFLSTVVGIAWDRGLIRDVDDFARDYTLSRRYWHRLSIDGVTVPIQPMWSGARVLSAGG